MGDASIPVDLFNPGQVFACLGFLEAADVLLGDAKGGFDWSDEANVRFRMCAKEDENPFSVVLSFLASAKVISLAPPTSRNSTEKWAVPTEVLSADGAFPFPDPSSPATLPAVLEGTRSAADATAIRLAIDHWGDTTSRDTVKFWGGAAGYPGAALARDAIHLVRNCCNSASDPFNLSAEQSSSFRLDWRRDYIPIDAGFSLNSHSGRIVAVGFPLVEILAAIGLSNARPKRIHVLEYKYGVIGSDVRTVGRRNESILFEPVLVRVALGGSDFPFVRRGYRIFRMRLGWPAKEGQARAITAVTEETNS